MWSGRLTWYRAMRFLLTGLLCWTLVVVPAQACFQAGGQTSYGYSDVGSKRLFLYLEAQSATSGPFLSTNPDAGAASAYTPTETGVASVPGSYGHTAGLAVPFLEFKFGTLEQDYYLNLSRFVQVTMFWTTAAPAAVKPGTVRVEIWTNDASGKPVLVMGDSKGTTAANVALNPMKMIQRPEVSVLLKGQPISIRVYRLAGYADFGVGTGGSQQSFIEIGYFDRDPLDNPLYLDSYNKNKFHIPMDGGEEDSDPHEVSVLASLVGLVLVTSLPRRGSSARLIVLVLLAAALAGCAGGNTPGIPVESQAPPSGTVEVNVRENETLRQAGTSTIEGVVLENATALPVGRSHVALLGTRIFTETGKSGRFSFANITSASYHLRIDAKGFVSYETQVEAPAGSVVTLEIRLDPPGGKKRFDLAHLHDDWAGQTERLLYEGPAFNGVLPTGGLVLPGATRMSIVLTWTPAPNGPFEQEIKIDNPILTGLCFAPRKPGVPYQFAFFPNEADSGHAKASQWRFDFGTLPSARVEIRIFKGVVPFEPPHKDFWGTNTSRVMLTNAPPKLATTSTTPPHDHPNPNTVWDKDFFVPPGTGEIRGNLRWTNPTLDPTGVPQTQWKLLYKPANVPWGPLSDPAKTPGLKRATMTANGTNNYNFVISPVLPDEVDQFYQLRTAWGFMLEDGNEPLGASSVRPVSVNTNADTKWLLSATAFRDPAYTE